MRRRMLNSCSKSRRESSSWPMARCVLRRRKARAESLRLELQPAIVVRGSYQASNVLRGSTGKYVLRKAIEPWLPNIARTKRKIGFQLPLSDWFMGGFNDFAREAWRSSGASQLGLLDAPGVERMFDEHRAGSADHGRMLYAIAMFSCWWTQQRQAAKPVPTCRKAALAS